MPELAKLQADLREILAEAALLAVKERETLKANLKPDGSIVTTVDVAVEELLKSALLPLIPGAGYWGEETGHDPERTQQDEVWLVDPIDGTSNFRFGLPLWGISVGLMSQGKLVLGGIALPDLHETYIAADGLGATVNSRPLEKIKQGPIEPHELVSVSENLIRNHPTGNWPGKMRLSGAFVIDGTYVAAGRFRGLIGRREKLYDVAASVVIGREVGAVTKLATGEPWNEANYLSGTYLEQPWTLFPEGSDWTLREDF